MLTLIVTVLCVLSRVVNGQRQTCYWPNGDVADGYSACAGLNGPCCAAGWNPCLPEAPGYCLAGGGFIYRGACTDQKWEATGCATQCVEDGNGDLLGSWEALTICPLNNYVCCGFASQSVGTCCDDQSGGFVFIPPDNGIWFGGIVVPGSASASCPGSVATVTVTKSKAATQNSPPADNTVTGGGGMTQPTGIVGQTLTSPSGSSTTSQGAAASVGALVRAWVVPLLAIQL